MRFSTPLHTSRKQHILKWRQGSGLIALIWLVITLVFLLFFVHITQLDGAALWMGFLASLIRISVAYGIALLIALVLAVIMSSHVFWEDLLLPVFDVLQSFPSFALFPALVTVLHGQSEVIIVLVLVVTMVWPILFSIISGLKNRREDWEEAATIFGATGLRRFWHFTFPHLLPSLVTGSIVGWGEGWEFIIGAELLVLVNTGIGQYLGKLGESGQNSLLAFGIVVFMLLLFLVNKLVWLPLLHTVTRYENEA